MNDFPASIAPLHHVQPVPRRIRAVAGTETIVDTLGALYVWESPAYPRYYFPASDVNVRLLTAEGAEGVHGLEVAGMRRSNAARLITASPDERLAGTWRFEWDALDHWYEEDEEVYVHARNPYTRVDALRSTRLVRIELDGVVLAESSSPVIVFETGLPTRYYLNRTDVRFEHLVHSPTVTRCPYKGTTTDYWSVVAGGRTHKDLAWSYAFPTVQLTPIAGLVAFYNERLDIVVDGRRLERARAHIA